MLHGFMSNKESFYYQIAYFKNFRRVLAIDLTGFGSSKKMQSAYSLDDYVKDVLSVINYLNLSSYDVLAHSFGGRIAIKLAKEDKRLQKLVLTGSAGLKPKRKFSYYFKVYSYKLLKKFVGSQKLKSFGSYEYRLLSGYEKQSYVKIVNCFLDKTVKTIENKTLLVFGKCDTETPIYMAKRFNKYIKNSQLYLIDGGSHFCFLDKPYEFNAVVKEFLIGD